MLKLFLRLQVYTNINILIIRFLICPQKHPIILIPSNNERIKNITCDVCKNTIMNLKVGSYGCEICDFYKCLSCFK